MPGKIGALASIRTFTLICTNGCSYLFGIARVIHDFSTRNTAFRVAEVYQMSHLG